MKIELDHLPQDKQQNIQYIVDVLRDEFEQVSDFVNGKKKHSRIMLIILFGSYAKGSWVDDPENGYISDYDLLVVLNRSELVEEHKIWHTAEERITQKLNAPVNILMHTQSEVNEKLQQGHYFFSDIQNEGIQLYQYGNAKLVDAGELSPAEAKHIAEKHYAQWFESASSFFITYQQVLERGDLKQAAFQLHQATERYLGCILLVFTNHLPKSHNLKLLYHLAMEQSEELNTVFPQDNKFHRRCFDLLKRAYIDARYSEHFKINEEELTYLEERVKQLQTLTEKSCKARIDAY